MIRHAVLTLALLAVGCGGAVVGARSDAGSDAGAEASIDAPGPDSGADASPSDAAHDSGKPWSPVCPEAAPAVGSPCTPPDSMDVPELLCEYGGPQFDPSCDTVVTCQSGTWQVANIGPSCQPDGPNPAACPASYAGATGSDSSCSAAGTRCEYPQGVCICSTGFGGPIEIDASTRWYCDPPPGCPMPRPRLGSSCSGTSTTCEYSPCDFAEQCSGGFWQGLFEGCAKAGSPGG